MLQFSTNKLFYDRFHDDDDDATDTQIMEGNNCFMQRYTAPSYCSLSQRSTHDANEMC